MSCGTVSPLQLLHGARRADEALVGGVGDLHPVQRVQVLRDPYFALVSIADFFRYEQEDPGRARVVFVICLTAGHRACGRWCARDPLDHSQRGHAAKPHRVGGDVTL